MIYRVLAIVAFVAVIVGAVLLSGQQRETTTQTTVDEPMQGLGYAARKAELIETGPDGHPVYRLIADLIRQLPDRDIVDLEQVQLIFRDATGNQWIARSKRGEVGQNTGKVELTGDVHVAGVLPGTEQPAEILTDRLAFDSYAQILSTHDPVTLEWSGHRLNAQGLLASLKDHRLQLESAVHGIFTP
jgi:lipopolysaccharide export system protein LptC